MHGTPNFNLQMVAAPIVVAVLFILATSRLEEPNRRHFMAIMIAGAGAAYLSGGLGVWEFAFTALVTACAFKGLNSYRLIGLGWVFHTVWDVLHHRFGNPIISFLPASSIGCAICDVVIALWCFDGAPKMRTDRWRPPARVPIF